MFQRLACAVVLLLGWCGNDKRGPTFRTGMSMGRVVLAGMSMFMFTGYQYLKESSCVRAWWCLRVDGVVWLNICVRRRTDVLSAREPSNGPLEGPISSRGGRRVAFIEEKAEPLSPAGVSGLGIRQTTGDKTLPSTTQNLSGMTDCLGQGVRRVLRRRHVLSCSWLVVMTSLHSPSSQ